MSGTKRKHAEDTGLSVDDFTGTAKTTIVTTNVDACAAVIRAFSEADEFSIRSNTPCYKDRLDLNTRSSDGMLSIIDHVRHGEDYRLTIKGSHDVISKGWNVIKLAARQKSDEAERRDSNNPEVRGAPKVFKPIGFLSSKRIKTEPENWTTTPTLLSPYRKFKDELLKNNRSSAEPPNKSVSKKYDQ